MKLALGYVVLLLAFTGARDIIGSSKCELETSEPGRRGICTKCKYDEDDGVGCYGSGHNEEVSRCIDGRCMLYPQGNVKKGNVCRLCNGDRVAEVVQAVENEYRVAYVVEAKENEQKTSAEYKQCLGNCNDADYKNIVECRDRLGGLFGCLIMCKSKCKAQCKFKCVSWAANRCYEDAITRVMEEKQFADVRLSTMFEIVKAKKVQVMKGIMGLQMMKELTESERGEVEQDVEIKNVVKLLACNAHRVELQTGEKTQKRNVISLDPTAAPSTTTSPAPSCIPLSLDLALILAVWTVVVQV